VDLNFSDRAQINGLELVVEQALARRGLLDSRVKFGVTLPQTLMFSAYHDLTEQVTLLGNIGWQDWSEFGKVGVGVSSLDTGSTNALS